MNEKVIDISKALEERQFKAKETRLEEMKAAFAAARKEAAASKTNTARLKAKTQKNRRKKQGKKK